MLTLLALLFSVQVHAEGASATIKEVDTKNKVIAIEPKDATKAGDRWVWETNEDSCTFQVYTVRGKVASARTEECESIKKIRSGQKVKLSLIDVEEEVVTPKAQPQAQQEPVIRPGSDLPTINENWYLQFGGGFSGVSYQGIYKEAVDAYNDASGSKSHLALSLNLGFYMPLKGHVTMLGGNIDSTGDVYIVDDSTSGKQTLSISHNFYAFSAQHFFGRNIGNGWFVRGDLGLANTRYTVDTSIGDETSKTKSGIGILGGGGYSMPCGSETRIAFFLNVSHRSYGKDKATISTLGANFLF